MRLLVTGGSGFIGSRLALAARERNLEVRVTSQINSCSERLRADELARAGISITTGPLQDADFARRIVADRDVVIHLAAAQHEANVPDSYFEVINVGGTQSLLEASRRAGVKRFIYGSTIGVYGSAQHGMLDEESPTQPDNIYGRTKLAAEQLVRANARLLETCIVRISETYGPGDFRLLKLFRAIDRGAFVMIGGGQNQHQIIHVKDLVRGLLTAATAASAVNHTFIMAGTEILTTEQMVGAIADTLRRPVPRWRAPLWPFIAAATVLETVCRPVGVQPPLHRRRLDFFRKSFAFSNQKAVAKLGFMPQVLFHDGAREATAWYREHGLLAGSRDKG